MGSLTFAGVVTCPDCGDPHDTFAESPGGVRRLSNHKATKRNKRALCPASWTVVR